MCEHVSVLELASVGAFVCLHLCVHAGAHGSPARECVSCCTGHAQKSTIHSRQWWASMVGAHESMCRCILHNLCFLGHMASKEKVRLLKSACLHACVCMRVCVCVCVFERKTSKWHTLHQACMQL